MENTKGIEPPHEDDAFDDAFLSTPLTTTLLLVLIGAGFLLYQALH
jgi:hypothetical protein